MKTPQKLRSSMILTCFLAVFPLQLCFGWGKDGHRIINRVAIQTLPADVPAFLRSARAIRELEYLAPEPDRWRSEQDLNSAQAPEHFIDLELAEVAAPNGLPERRLDFIHDLYAAQVSHAGIAQQLIPQRIGLLPWQANEWFERLEVDMREYRIRSAARADTHGAEEAILYDAGMLGHYVGDGSQPLHTTINYDGWMERDNPEGFTRNRGIHSEFETEFVHDNMRASDVCALVPAAPRVLHSPFEDFVAYLLMTHEQVAEVYRLQRHDGFEGKGSLQARNFTTQRLAAGATMLRDMIYSAWVQSVRSLP
jgi:hypothetical protein